MSFSKLKEFIKEHSIYFIIGGVFVALIIVLIVFLVNHKDGSSNDSDTAVELPETSVEVPKDKYLKQDENSNVYKLMFSYYSAIRDGDADAVAALCNTLSDTERYRIEEKAKYYSTFSNFNVYTKKGYADDSYLVLVEFDITYADTTTPAPSLDSVYVCTNESGALYINKADLTDDEEAYLLELSVQSDVEELIENVQINYNKALEGDETLAALIPEIESSVNEAVKTKLSEQQKENQSEEAEMEAKAQQEAKDASATTVRTTDNVNIRASASTDAEALGKASTGDTFKRYEEMENGWSKIDYNGKEAYIKSEYLETVGGDSSGDDASADSDSDSESSTQKGGKITVTENVNVRESASETSNKLGVAYRGDQFELIEKKDGWCKIKYDGKDAYVKADFVE